MGKFYLSQSTIKQFIRHGNELEYCPYERYKAIISREETRPTTLFQLRGQFFESISIGGVSSYSTHPVLDLPRKRLNKKTLILNPKAKGEKTVSQLRIEEQSKIFKEKAEQYGIVYNELNTQTKIYKRYEHDKSIILRGEMDIFPTIIKKDGKYKLAIIDLKLTGNLENGFGDFNWSDFESMDHLQAMFYLYLLKDLDFDLNDELNPRNNLRELIKGDILELLNNEQMIFIYWIFDYKPAYTDMFKEYYTSELKWKQFHETLRKATALLEMEHKLGWRPRPSDSLCNGCHVKSCEFYNQQFR